VARRCRRSRFVDPLTTMFRENILVSYCLIGSDLTYSAETYLYDHIMLYVLGLNIHSGFFFLHGTETSMNRCAQRKHLAPKIAGGPSGHQLCTMRRNSQAPKRGGVASHIVKLDC
jgi:hypothetical protein